MRLPVFSWLFLMAIYSLFLTIFVFGASAPYFSNQQSLLLQLKNNLMRTCNEGHVIGLDLVDEYISGGIDNSSSLFSLQHLESLSLAYNDFNYSHEIPSEFDKQANLSYLNLLNARFAGQIPIAISHLTSCNFVGSIPSSMASLTQLKYLDFSNNKFNGSIPNFSMCKNLTIELILASCKLKKIPDFLRNQSYLSYLDLSHNQIFGEMPIWIWKLPNLVVLDLSYNFLVTLEGPILNVSLQSQILRSNQLQGQLPNIPHVKYLDFSGNQLQGQLPNIPHAEYLDFSGNQLQGQLPNIPHVEYLDLSGNSLDPSILANISWSLPSIRFIFLSSNKFYGSIPISICNATNLELLDLSNNSISGTIPQCLIKMTGTLGVLNLRTNNLSGIIPDAFLDNCGLQTLSLNKNQLEGRLPKSLANCSWLEVLDIGNNHIEELNLTWPGLQIVDIASNNFTGTLPIILLLSWTSMMDRGNEKRTSSKTSIPKSRADALVMVMRRITSRTNVLDLQLQKSFFCGSKAFLVSLKEFLVDTDLYAVLQRYVTPSLLWREFAEVCEFSPMALNNSQYFCDAVNKDD
ncbi:hypothetical protein FH972_011532 [Carpinus fangiana]|uniref:Leucine-rich repeat-containing N-terminal plant-type domain-containing protein n=1 Tax=Carpinus fangiana TaxID=176857 RepID=A0A660KXQ2_9ROSI|nr:hypothetical protein FH972_011532 [Carpinus fangiana]